MSSEIPARLPVLAFGWFQDNDNPHIRGMKLYNDGSAALWRHLVLLGHKRKI